MTSTDHRATALGSGGFSVVHAPIPEIKVALVGPLIAAAAGSFRMILLSANDLGLDISCTRVFLSPGEPAAAFWNRVLRHHRACCAQPLAVLPQRSTDSWDGVESLQTWRAKPLQQEHLKSGLEQISAALNTDFSALLMQQPSINFIMTGRLLRLAHAYGTNAMKYAVQAVATEPLGLLHFAVSGLPKSERILETIFSGESLPSALTSQMGIKKSVLRRARKSPGGIFAAATTIDVQPVRRAWAWVEKMQRISLRVPGGASENGKNRTLRPGERA